jgi:hypothetical protein
VKVSGAGEIEASACRVLNDSHATVIRNAAIPVIARVEISVE